MRAQLSVTERALRARRLTGRWNVSERVGVEPGRKVPDQCLGRIDLESGPLGRCEGHVTAPPGDQRSQRRAHAYQLGEPGVLVTKRRLGPLEQHEARPM